jgi:hypothetical protein
MDQVLSRSSRPAAGAHGVSLSEAFWVWLRVSLLSFGGPAGQIAVMHRITPAVAIFRFKIGMIPVLAACSLAGVLLYLAGFVG